MIEKSGDSNLPLLGDESDLAIFDRLNLMLNQWGDENNQDYLLAIELLDKNVMIVDPIVRQIERSERITSLDQIIVR